MHKLTSTILLSALCANAMASETDQSLQGSVSAYAGLLSETRIKDSAAALSDTADGNAFGVRGQLGNDLVFVYVDRLDSDQDFTINGVGIDVDTTETRTPWRCRLSTSGRKSPSPEKITI